jgi:hypothetical protein
METQCASCEVRTGLYSYTVWYHTALSCFLIRIYSYHKRYYFLKLFSTFRYLTIFSVFSGKDPTTCALNINCKLSIKSKYQNIIIFVVEGFHIRDCENLCVLWQKFRRNILLPSSGSNNNMNKHPGMQQSASALPLWTLEWKTVKLYQNIRRYIPEDSASNTSSPWPHKCFKLFIFFRPQLSVNLVDASLF